ncbi:MAG: hypothetical protein ABH864_03695 [archaeon]
MKYLTKLHLIFYLLLEVFLFIFIYYVVSGRNLPFTIFLTVLGLIMMVGSWIFQYKKYGRIVNLEDDLVVPFGYVIGTSILLFVLAFLFGILLGFFRVSNGLLPWAIVLAIFIGLFSLTLLYYSYRASNEIKRVKNAKITENRIASKVLTVAKK